MVKQLLVIVGVLVATAGPAWAAVLDFGMIAPTSGTISYGGGVGTALVGTDIEVDEVTGLGGTPLNNLATFDIIGGDLDFTTGGFVSTVFGISSFGSGGTITLVGGVNVDTTGDLADLVLTAADLDDPGDLSIRTLFSGTWTSPVTVINISGTSKIFGAAFVDVKDDDLVALFGYPGSGLLWTGAINLSFSTSSSATAPTAFSTGTVLSGDITNEPSVVPEPASAGLLLMGLGLLGGGIGSSRKKLF
jgi:hypothetical protein